VPGIVVSSAALPFDVSPIPGSVVDRAPATGEIHAAALDVFEREPAVHEALLRSRGAILAPHAGSATTTARRRMAETCARAVRVVLDGRMPDTVVNPEVYE
jgi:glyoxylate reductase